VSRHELDPLGRRVPTRVQVERPQPRSGEDDRPGRARRRRQDVRPRRVGLQEAGSGGDRPDGRGAGLISLSPPRGEAQVGWEGLRSGGANYSGAVYAARGFAAPAGAKGWAAVSMYQIASASRRVRSIRAIWVPRWRPSRALVRW
jgi:hypothetical protein